MAFDRTNTAVPTSGFAVWNRFNNNMVGSKHVFPVEVADAERRAVAGLIARGAARNALKAGDRIPAIVLSDSNGRIVEACDLLARGPLVAAFHRGMWCPFGNLALQALEVARAEIELRGASVVAISQQTASSARKSKRLNELGFPILVDPGGDVVARFGLRWTSPNYLQEAYRRIGINLAEINGDGSSALPIPALFVIGTDGVVSYAEIDPDVTHSWDPFDVFPVLDLLKGAGRRAW
jgi:peroxiredoxin